MLHTVIMFHFKVNVLHLGNASRQGSPIHLLLARVIMDTATWRVHGTGMSPQLGSWDRDEPTVEFMGQGLAHGRVHGTGMGPQEVHGTGTSPWSSSWDRDKPTVGFMRQG